MKAYDIDKQTWKSSKASELQNPSVQTTISRYGVDDTHAEAFVMMNDGSFRSCCIVTQTMSQGGMVAGQCGFHGRNTNGPQYLHAIQNIGQELVKQHPQQVPLPCFRGWVG